jgi:hypothetical protein
MKKLLTAVLLICSLACFAQDDEIKGFKKENVFIGTGVNLGFFNGFLLGLNPEFGYSVAKFMDVGVATNVTYVTQNVTNAPISYRQLVTGGGPFVRVWPVNMIFFGAQFEYNRISYSEKNNGSIVNRQIITSPSVLIGGGYGNRFIGQSQFYTSIMVDILRDPRSPYIDQFNRLQPVLRTAFLFYLKPKRQKGR